jgi:molybdopterin/thiamine biosynthesis adenylyltransferase
MSERYQRQSFLGPGAQKKIERVTAGVVGLGGGGSHIVQQLAHIGFKEYAIYDPQTADESNLNRLVGAGVEDVGCDKIKIARRMIKRLQPHAKISLHRLRWQEDPEPLMGCDLVFGCLDTFQDRDELETFCRRHLILYIDIGMDVHQVKDDPPRMAGQVILSAPGRPCMKCLGFITPEKLALEAAKYGVAGPRPQVVWPNGVLASSAVGIAINSLTNWTAGREAPFYLSYDGNRNTVVDHPRLRYGIPDRCPHYQFAGAGTPRIISL